MDKPKCVINPKSGRAVKADSRLGKQILAGNVKKEPHKMYKKQIGPVKPKIPNQQYQKPVGPVKPKEPNSMYKSSNDVRPNRKDFEKKKELETNGNDDKTTKMIREIMIIEGIVSEMKNFNEYFHYGNLYKITSKETLESDISKITDKFSNDAKGIQKQMPLSELMDKANKKQQIIIKKYLQTSKYKSFEKTMQGVMNDRLSEGKMNNRVMLDVIKNDKLKIGLKN